MSGDDDGRHYLLFPLSEERDNFEYERVELLNSGIKVFLIQNLLHKISILNTGEQTCGTLAIADLDGDGYTDLMFAAWSEGEVYVFSYSPFYNSVKDIPLLA